MFDDLYMNVADLYDAFLQECFASHGITEENIAEYAGRITGDRCSQVQNFDGTGTVTTDAFFLDDRHLFSVKQIIRYVESAPGVYKSSVWFELADKGGETNA